MTIWQFPMLLSADKHSRIAAAFERAAADPNETAEARQEYALKAKRFRALARRAAELEAARS